MPLPPPASPHYRRSTDSDGCRHDAGMGEPLTITIGHQETERVLLEVLGRERPNDDDYWDGNWLVVDVHVRVGGFIGHAVANLRTEEFRQFREALDAAYREVGGVAMFETREGWLTLTVTCGKGGKVTVEGEATDRPGMGNRLKFALPDMAPDLPACAHRATDGL